MHVLLRDAYIRWLVYIREERERERERERSGHVGRRAIIDKDRVFPIFRLTLYDGKAPIIRLDPTDG